MSLAFEWDPRKADEDHSEDEIREIVVGHSSVRRILLVCFAELERERVRIISARRATAMEQHDYEDNFTS